MFASAWFLSEPKKLFSSENTDPVPSTYRGICVGSNWDLDVPIWLQPKSIWTDLDQFGLAQKPNVFGNQFVQIRACPKLCVHSRKIAFFVHLQNPDLVSPGSANVGQTSRGSAGHSFETGTDGAPCVSRGPLRVAGPAAENTVAAGDDCGLADT